jgi:hypothetical protein
MIPFMAQNENVDMRKLTEEIVSGMGLSRRIIIPEAELEAMKQEAMQQQQAAMEAEAQAKLGGAAAGAPAMEAEQLAQLEAALAELPPDELDAIAAEENMIPGEA